MPKTALDGLLFKEDISTNGKNDLPARTMLIAPQNGYPRLAFIQVPPDFLMNTDQLRAMGLRIAQLADEMGEHAKTRFQDLPIGAYFMDTVSPKVFQKSGETEARTMGYPIPNVDPRIEVKRVKFVDYE